MVNLTVYQGSLDPSTIYDFKAIPVEVFNEIQILAAFSIQEAWELLNSTPKLFTNYLKQGYGSTSVVAVSDVKDFLSNF